MPRALSAEILTDGSRQEKYHDHRCRDPERTVEVRVSLQHIEEIGAREDGGVASAEDLIGVDVEELRVEGEGPEEALGG